MTVQEVLARRNASIDRLHLDTRADNALKRFGITTLGQLLEYDAHRLAQIPGIGQRTASRIWLSLNRYISSTGRF